MGKFVRDFSIEAQAKAFAASKCGTIVVHYDYINDKIIKTYRVRY